MSSPFRGKAYANYATSTAIDPTKLTRPRQFARTAQTSRDADRSLWTETPAERQQRIADEVAGKRRRAVDVDPTDDTDIDARKRRKYEEEVRRGVEEHTVRLKQIGRAHV